MWSRSKRDGTGSIGWDEGQAGCSTRRVSLPLLPSGSGGVREPTSLKGLAFNPIKLQPGQRPGRTLAKMAEREGFEPSVHLVSIHALSKRAPSTARTSLLWYSAKIRTGFSLNATGKTSFSRCSRIEHTAFGSRSGRLSQAHLQLIIWRAQHDSNVRPSDPQSDTLSS